MSWHAHVTVAAVIEDNDRFLMIEEKAAGKNVFNQPAGHLEKDESLVDAVIREVLEETARDFKPRHVIGIYLYPSQENGVTYLRVCFSGEVSDELPERELDKEIIRTTWMSREQVLERSDRLRSPLVIDCIEDYLDGKKYPLDILSHLPQ